MSRPPRKRAASRRYKPARDGDGLGIGPENLPRDSYRVEIIMICEAHGKEMGRAIRLTAPDMDGETETRPIPGTNILPRQNEDGHEKWRFGCPVCGRDVPRSDSKIEDALDALDPDRTAWLRKSVPYRC